MMDLSVRQVPSLQIRLLPIEHLRVIEIVHEQTLIQVFVLFYVPGTEG